MLYTWKQELYISSNLTDNCNAVKKQNLQFQVQGMVCDLSWWS